MQHKSIEAKQLFDQIIQAENQLTDLRMEYWQKYELFEVQWWILLAILIIPLVIWWKLVDKNRFFQIAFLGFLAFLIALEADILGHEMGVWHYPHKLLCFGPQLLPIDFSLFSVTYMLVYQYYSSWKQYLIAATIVAVIFTFVGEPLLDYLGIYKLVSWEYWYSLPIYFLIFVFLKWFVDKLILKLGGMQ